jgi:V8-like Glu-specific endopeptidase
LKYIPPDEPRASGVLRGEGEKELLDRLVNPPRRLILPASSASYSRSTRTVQALPTDGTLSTTNLVQISNTGDEPWRYICNLEITKSDGGLLGGTGWLLGLPGTNKQIVVTAGHCVFQKDVNDWAYSIKVTPARNITSEPYQHQVVMDGMVTVEGWKKNFQPVSDYGAILLPQPFSAGSFGCQAIGAANLSALLVSVAGYPVHPDTGDATYGSLWGEAHYLQPVANDDRQLVYKVSVREGISGGPVFVTSQGERIVVGIQNYESFDDTTAYATRITQSVFDHLKAWLDQAG